MKWVEKIITGRKEDCGGQDEPGFGMIINHNCPITDSYLFKSKYVDSCAESTEERSFSTLLS